MISVRKMVSITLLVLLAIILPLQFIGYKLHHQHPLKNYSEGDIHRVLSKVIKHNKQLMNPDHNMRVAIALDPATYFNAFVYESKDVFGNTVVTITVTQGLLNMVKTEDQLAAVLGHEWGHYINGDTKGRWVAKESERIADMTGAWMTDQAGYDACYARETWKELRERDGHDGYSHSHPSYPQRIETLNCEFQLKSKIENAWRDFNETIDNSIKKVVDLIKDKYNNRASKINPGAI